MGRLSASPAQAQRYLPEVLRLVRSQPLVWWSTFLRPKPMNKPVGMILMGLWTLLFMTGAGASWPVGAALAMVVALVMWPVMVWWDRWGLSAIDKRVGCYVDFEQRVVRQVLKAIPNDAAEQDLFQGLYVHAQFDLKHQPSDAWSIGVVEAGRNAREWHIELRHRSQGPVCRLCQVQPTVIPGWGVPHQVDALVDVLCQRLGVRRSGSRLRRLKRRQ